MTNLNSEAQARFRARNRQGLAVIPVEVNLELVAQTLTRMGYRDEGRRMAFPLGSPAAF
jgi:hypothetical protein